MCNYRCPHAERKKCAGFLLCRLMYKDGINYNIRENAMNAICAHQKQCMNTGLMENTDEARDCYEWRIKAMAEAKKAVIEEDSAFIGENVVENDKSSADKMTVTTAVSGKSSGKKKKKN